MSFLERYAWIPDIVVLVLAPLYVYMSVKIRRRLRQVELLHRESAALLHEQRAVTEAGFNVIRHAVLCPLCLIGQQQHKGLCQLGQMLFAVYASKTEQFEGRWKTQQ